MKTRELLPKDVTYYKANLHCHTVFSDGKMTPEEVKKNYQEKGYQVLAITDHDHYGAYPFHILDNTSLFPHFSLPRNTTFI